jgi:hypothetical protein
MTQWVLSEKKIRPCPSETILFIGKSLIIILERIVSEPNKWEEIRSGKNKRNDFMCRNI